MDRDRKALDWAFSMRCLGYTRGQIARALGVSEETVRHILNAHTEEEGERHEQ